MPANPVHFCYASVDDFRAYMAGSGYSSDWTQDGAILRRILEAVSRRMEQALGGRTWGPRTETRVYDLGAGALRNDVSMPGRVIIERPDYWVSGAVRGIIPLDDWLLSATTITAYADTDRTSNQTLTAETDYYLEPYNASPKTQLKLSETTTKTLSAGQKTLTILGSWGWQNVTRTVSGALAEALDSSETGIDVVSGPAFEAGQTITADSEQLYITAITGNTLTVVRGVNGTSAAAHNTGIDLKILEYPADIVQTCLDIARNRWKERDGGISQTMGGGEAGIVISRPGAEERALLRERLAHYRAEREHAGVYF